uniref:Uncharacterized protein n=1 Tax=Candidatus Kentrum sp. LPFa TaxID=2126335 RepID=A0A450Y3T4_9GAMM|nr:MAG: hypothetical protein BECKLPF1236A_GA0070988_105972 [Candidatus Kentron sp. LPFa]VFK36197.1 MAG: hypothetical protein BECKLPF1236C_GA0070990_105163 [Candidatus Kentron sp. LPFa]
MGLCTPVRRSVPEALIVHIADNLEGIEKGFHAARGAKEIIEDVLKNIKANLEIYRDKKEVDELLGTVAHFFVQEILIPGIEVIADAYGIEMDMQGMLKGSFSAETFSE